MKVWKRAGLYLIRKKSRSIILFLLLFVMANLIMVGNAMRRSADDEIERIRKKLGCSFVVAADTDNPLLYEERFDEEFSYKIFTGRNVTPQLIEEIMEVDGIIDCEIKDYKIVWTDLDLKPGLWAGSTEDEDFSIEEIEIWRHYTYAVICRTGEMNENFRTGAFTILEGRNLTEEDSFSAVISEYLAETNQLAVGDKIRIETKRGLYEPSDVPEETLGVPIEMEVVGIFSVNFEQEPSFLTPENCYADNLLFVDQETGKQIRKNQEFLGPSPEAYNEAVFFVEDPEKLGKVMEDVEQSIDLSELLVILDDSAYSASVKPLKQISLFSLILIISGSVGAVTVLYLVFSLWLKSRIREIKIYRSIGFKKGRIIRQMVLECLIITTIALGAVIIFLKPVTESVSYVSAALTDNSQEGDAYSLEIKIGAPPEIAKIESERVELFPSYSGTDFILLAAAVYGISCLSVLAAALQTIKKCQERLL